MDSSINMNISNELSSAIFICFTCVLLSTVNSLPFLFGNQNGNRPVVPYQSPPDDWNISSVPRSIMPHLMVKYNETVNRIISGRRSDAEINNDTLKYLRAMKVCARTFSIYRKRFVIEFDHEIFLRNIFNCRKVAQRECYGLIRPISCTIHHSLIRR